MNRLRYLLILLFTGASLNAAGQNHLQDLTKEFLSRERAAILDALRTAVRKELRQDVKFVVTWLKVYKGYAFFSGQVKSASGGDIDFSTIPAYKDAVEGGIFDGDATTALLKKVAGRWQYVTHAIGPTDVAHACWWKEFKAPRQIFNLSEDCNF